MALDKFLGKILFLAGGPKKKISNTHSLQGFQGGGGVWGFNKIAASYSPFSVSNSLLIKNPEKFSTANPPSVTGQAGNQCGVRKMVAQYTQAEVLHIDLMAFSASIVLWLPPNISSGSPTKS